MLRNSASTWIRHQKNVLHSSSFARTNDLSIVKRSLVGVASTDGTNRFGSNSDRKIIGDTSRNALYMSICRRDSKYERFVTSSSPLRLFSSSTESETPTSADNDTKANTSSIQEETMEFQAETRQLLDIVINSLYTDKEVFIRELISNASDALEKLRHLQVTNSDTIINNETPLEIKIDLDEVTSTITITDTGIGMNRDDMIRNLGTIARSGSKNFVKELQGTPNDATSSIIGQFGVGFYSAFMVADKVDVRSKSGLKDHENEITKIWSSDGVMGSYTISDLSDDIRQDRGTSIVLHMNEKYWNYVNETKIETILKRYSNFVNFPIYVNGKRINTQSAIWTIDPKEVTDDQYNEFYKYYANAYDEPLDTYHFRVDAPIDMKVLFFIPSFHTEKYGMGRMEPGVNLYSRKILIESKSPDILPDWMRFIKGVVDSEDLPLAISREKTQDSALITKLRKTLVRKFVAHLTTMKKKDPTKFLNEFYKEYSFFIKEGICQDYEFQSQLSKLLHFHTSKDTEIGKPDMVSLDEYISRMRPEQNDIYYLVAPSRKAALNSPYLEAFQKANIEVLFLYTTIEDFVMANLEQYENRKFISVDKTDIDLSAFNTDNDDDNDATKKNDNNDDESNIYKADRELNNIEIQEFIDWFRKDGVGEDKIALCTVTNRLSTSPAIVTGNESGAMRRMMKLVDTSSSDYTGLMDGVPLPKQNVEINIKHPIIVGMYELIHLEPTLAKVLAQQVYDNCLIAAGLLDDSRSILPRLNDLLVCVVNSAKQQHKETKTSEVINNNTDINDDELKETIKSDVSESKK